MRKVECFKIRICTAKTPFHSIGQNVIKEILCTHNLCVNEPTTIVADPFLFVKDDTLFLFYEDKKMYHNGVISMTKTTDLEHWTKPVVVLKESCHLSYPWVFEHEGHIYMIPETCGLKEIRLYKANDSLTDFKYVKTILKDEFDRENGFSFSDTSILKKEDIYYLMTTVNDNGTNVLKLYISESLDGGYTEHRCTPICIGNKYGRNAGCLFEHEGKLLRVAQDCVKRYGDNVHLIEVKTMNKVEYKEQPIRDFIIPTNTPFYKEGGHQFNFVKFNGKYVIATDAKEYRYYVLNRILHKLGVYK